MNQTSKIKKTFQTSYYKTYINIYNIINLGWIVLNRNFQTSTPKENSTQLKF